ncbi:MAG: response regulator [Bdellovibrionales bacterium]|nr:response regulator [Bdellovibrionales bacterium]
MNVLFIEDSPSDFFLIGRTLKKSYTIEAYEQATSEAELLIKLGSRDWDVVLSDFNLPGFSAHKALDLVREKDKNIPFILVSGAIGEEATVDILKAGANDVVIKSNLARLPISIDKVLWERKILERESEAQKEKEAAVKAREEMLAIVSHDLRNPLAAIQLNAEAMIKSLNADPHLSAGSMDNNIKAILRTSRRMNGLISDILDKVRIDAGTLVLNKKKRNLKIFIQDFYQIFEPLAREKDIKFSLDTENVDHVVKIDFDRVFQILSNLLGNALKFTPPYGKVSLAFRIQSGHLNINVIDSGIGIDQESLNRIFDKYWQDKMNKRLGVGLGLAIVKELVLAHDGSIDVESQPGKGTNFKIIIPDVIVTQSTSAENVTKMEGRKDLLLVEDDDDLREVLEFNLKSLKYNVMAFSNGKDAIDAITLQASPPHLIILDYRLPDMSGGEIANAVRDKFPQVFMPVIFLSAETHLDSIAMNYEATAFLTKPLSFKDLENLIDEISD